MASSSVPPTGQTGQTAAIAGEFAGAMLGDVRLTKRLVQIAERLVVNPALPFPRAMAMDADLEGYYRFLRNPETSFQAVLEPHIRATVERAIAYAEVVAVHDSSDFRYGGFRKGLGRLKETGHGFIGHFSLLVSPNEAHDPLGVLAVEPWARDQTTANRLVKMGKISYRKSLTMPKEQERWFRGVQACEAAFERVACSLIHVMDSEADDYKLMAQLVQNELRWVIRQGVSDRRLANALPGQKTKDLIARCPVVAKRQVTLSKRRNGAGSPGVANGRRNSERSEREATLAIRAGQVQLKSPTYLSEHPPELTVNVVMVSEMRPPKGEEPVDWVLLTTESIDTNEEVLKIVDLYRARWKVEEFFKALKTGCAIEKRQLDSFDTLLTALAIFIPIAWHLLRLRAVAREEPTAPPQVVLTPTQIEVLRRAAKDPLPKKLTAQAVLMAVARLGGHLHSNGPPGWQVLGRGYQDLLMLVAGYRLAREEM
jgi:hypothetical protein